MGEKLSEAARQARNKYHRDYYAAHKDKFRKYRNDAWERKAEQAKKPVNYEKGDSNAGLSATVPGND